MGNSNVSHKKNSIYGFIGFALPALAVLVAYPVLFNNIGVEATGIYLLATSLSGAWAVLDFGIFAATLRYVSEDVEKKDFVSASDIILTSIVFYIVIGVLFTVLIIFSSEYLVDVLSIGDEYAEEAVIAFIIAGIRFSLFFLNMVFISVFKSLHKFEYSTIVMTGLSVITFGGAAIGASLYDLGLVGISVIALLGNIFGIVLSFFLCVALLRKNNIFLTQGSPKIASFKRMFSYGVFLAINGIMTSGFLLLQKFLISIFIGPAAVAIYTVASTIISKIQAAIFAGFEFLLPWAARVKVEAKNAEISRLKMLYIKSTLASITILGVIVVFLIFFRSNILEWWLGEGVYADVDNVLGILLIGLVVWGLLPTGYHLVNGIGHPKVNTVFLVINVAVFFLLLVSYSADGLVVEDFALSQAAALGVQGGLFFIFIVTVVWKKWLSEREA